MMNPPSSIAARVARAFPVPAVIAGLTLLHQQKVTIKSATPRSVDATVKSQHLRRVRIEARGSSVAVACSCTPKAVGLAACKHLWAAFLAVDRIRDSEGALASLREETSALELTGLETDLAELEPEKPTEKEKEKEKEKKEPKSVKSRPPAKTGKRGTGRSTRRHASRA